MSVENLVITLPEGITKAEVFAAVSASNGYQETIITPEFQPEEIVTPENLDARISEIEGLGGSVTSTIEVYNDEAEGAITGINEYKLNWTLPTEIENPVSSEDFAKVAIAKRLFDLFAEAAISVSTIAEQKAVQEAREEKKQQLESLGEPIIS